MTYPGEEKHIDARNKLRGQLIRKEEEGKRLSELWKLIKDLDYDDLLMLSTLIIERTKPMIEAREKVSQARKHQQQS